jgi:hypothetical protein
MQNFPVVYQSSTKAELTKQVLDVHSFLEEYFLSIPEDLFTVEPEPEGWSIKENIQHIITINKWSAVYIGMYRPIFALLGKASSNQLKPEEIIVTNRRNVLNYGRYPSKAKPYLKKPILCAKILSSAQKLNFAIEKRTEEELDTFAVPILKMSLRTFVYYLLKHNLHHANVVRLRLENK